MFPAKSSLFSSHEQLYVPSSSFLLCLSTQSICTMYTAGNPMLVRMILLPQGTRRKTAPSFKSQFHALQHPSLQGIIAHPQTWYNTPSFKYIFVKTLFLFIAGKMPVCNFGAKFWVLSVVNVVQGTACHCLVFLHDHNIYMHHQPANRENLTDWSVKFEFNTSMITSCQKSTFCNRI